MLKIENVVIPSPEQWRATIMGARNAMNSWDRSDSEFTNHELEDWPHDKVMTFEKMGPNDHDLLMRLRNAGTDHRKFMRMITVYVDLTAPLYWWKEFDTYKVGTVANSCSTMHKIAAKEFTLEDFSHEHLIVAGLNSLKRTIDDLNSAREGYLDERIKQNPEWRKEVWWQMIQLLPSSYNQRRTVQMNYEVLANIYKSRRNHKLDEWHTFCDWIEGLPYSELITGMEPISHEVVSDSTPLFLRKSMTIPEEWPFTVEEASKIFEELGRAINKIWNPDIEDSVDISHLVDITCSWDVEELGGERIYAIGPGFTREDLTPYELYLLEKSEEYEKRKKGGVIMEERKSFATFKDGYTEEIFYFEKYSSDKILFATRSGVYIYQKFDPAPGMFGLVPSTEFFRISTSWTGPVLTCVEEYAIKSFTLDERVKVRFMIDGEAGEILVAADATDEQIKVAILDEVLEGYEIIKE